MAVITYATEQEWLDARNVFVTATDSAAILNESPWNTPYSLWCKKMGLMEPVAENEYMYWGKALEPLIRQRYEQVTSRLVEHPAPYTLHVSEEHPFMAATLDGQAYCPERDSLGVVEIKTASIYTKADWEGEPPLQYQIQLQHQMAVTGYDWGSIAVLLGGNTFYYVDIERNDSYIEKMIPYLRDFHKLMEEGVAPAVDGEQATTAALKEIYEAVNMEEIRVLSPEAHQADERIMLIKDHMKELEKELAHHQNIIKAEMENAEIGLLPDARWKRTVVNVKGYTKTVEPHQYTRLTRAVRKD